MSQQQNNDMQKHFYRASAADFGKIPSSPVAYWASKAIFRLFSEGRKITDFVNSRDGLTTGNNETFIRYHFEVSRNSIGFGAPTPTKFWESKKRFAPLIKGGSYRKWYGNLLNVITYDQGSYQILSESGNKLPSRDYYFRESINWTRISSPAGSFRHTPQGCIFESASLCAYSHEQSDLVFALAAANSSIAVPQLNLVNPTTNLLSGYFDMLRVPESAVGHVKEISSTARYLVTTAKSDWDSCELSWDFTNLPLLHSNHRQPTLKASYQKLQVHWRDLILEMQSLEEENNRIFIEAYGLQDELTPEVPLSEITLTCNPHYRYGGNLTDEERKARLQSDTICELISYAIGCMMGRYSLDRDGLVYAHAGNEGFKALVEEGAYATFAADEDGILPLSTDSWFEDDVATRLEAFVNTVWGSDTLGENLQFIADSLCLAAIKPVKKGGETSRETLRRYLSTQFFKDHMKTYKKRPIYWLFSSGKEKAFECLVYLHRYNEASLPRMRTEYVTPLLGQMAGRIERLRLQQTEASTSDAKRIGKEIDSLTKQLAELRAFDDQLKHHADMRITLDLDDGVKVNYGKFGTLLSDVKAITGDKGE